MKLQKKGGYVLGKTEQKKYFDARFCFHGDETKVVAILDSYDHNKVDFTDINRVFELYHTKLFFEKVSEVPGWAEDEYIRYKNKTLKLGDIVYNFFKQITQDNILMYYNACYTNYREDFVNSFFKFKVYERISINKICDLLKELRWNTFQILSDKKFVEYFDEQITSLLEEPQYGLRFVIYYYLEEHDKKQKMYLPSSFTVEKRVKLIEDYLESDNINPNIIQLIIYARPTNKLPITSKLKKRADQRKNEFWKNNSYMKSSNYSFCVSFGPYENERNERFENGKWIFEYSNNWIKKNKDYPTLLNNFIYLFEYIDIQARCTHVSNGVDRSSILDMFLVNGQGMYRKGMAFEIVESLADAQMSAYVNQLNKIDIDIEDIIKWFFESYLLQEFGVENYMCNMPRSGDSILSKCKTLASAIDGVLCRYKLLCDDGKIDLELFKYITCSPRIKDVPSLANNKYCYVKSGELFKEINMLFSSKYGLGYTEKTGSKYATLYDLIKSEKISIEACETYNIEALNWLLDRKTIFLENNIIRYDRERMMILKEFYEKDVISLQHFKSIKLKEMIQKGDVITEAKLLTKPECQYFNYLLNNSEFSNGKAIRNQYVHDSIVPNEKIMHDDYITLLRIMILLIIKINDDCCIHDEIKKKGDFYAF